MEDTLRPASGRPAPWDYSMDADRLAMASILVVEDDRDIREMLSTFLEMAGFGVVACDTAEAGLNTLREQTFDLVLTDYALPRQSGLWLLEHAEAEGLLQGTPALIVTAHPNVSAGDAYEVIQKPFDLDGLLERVRYHVEGHGPRRRRGPSMGRREGNGYGIPIGGNPECPDPVELILYVSSQSPRSFAAVKNVKKVLERFHSSRVKLTVHDLSADPSVGVADSDAFTPTLVRKTPCPRTLILGHITNPELVLELLADCEVDRS